MVESCRKRFGGWRGKGAVAGTQGERWALGGSSNRKFFRASSDSPLTAAFLMTWRDKVCVGGCWTVPRSWGEEMEGGSLCVARVIILARVVTWSLLKIFKV